MTKLPRSFYTRPNVEEVARELLGKFLVTNINGVVTGGKIVETEAYAGDNDRACHSYLNRRTSRTEIMYHTGGVAYIYLIYGIYNLFNIITNEAERADAVLVRAVEPVEGVEEMLHRRQHTALKPNLTAGPGLLTQALGIDRSHYGADLTGSTIWLEDRGVAVAESEIVAAPRVGVAYAGEDALRPWRFFLKGNRWVSKSR